MTILKATDDNIIEVVASRLRKGEVIALPTETVYGLSAAVSNPEAVAKIYQIKNRPHDHPLIMHIAKIADLQSHTVNIPEYVLCLADKFWPGPLTFILAKNDNVPSSITGGQNSVAIRMPRHSLTLAIIDKLGCPIVAPSANKFMGVSPTRAQHVIDEFANMVDVVDGGESTHGIESTIVDVRDETNCVILRPGSISEDMIRIALAEKFSHITVSIVNKTNVKFSGNHKKHYSPKTRLVGFRTRDEFIELANQYSNFFVIEYSGFNHHPSKLYKLPSEPEAYAKEIYHALRVADQSMVDVILLELPPQEKAWLAINDRLCRAVNSD